MNCADDIVGTIHNPILILGQLSAVFNCYRSDSYGVIIHEKDMDLKNRRGKASFRSGILGGAALLFLVAFIYLIKLQVGKHALDSKNDPPLNAEQVSRIGLLEAYRTWSGGSAIFLDLRPNSAFTRTHIPGAISIPIEELEIRYLDLPDDRTIITYCDFPLEESSAQAALFLITHGFPNTTPLRGGIEGWIQSGYPIEP